MMDDISSYYKELSFLQLKYEHLVDANKSLLKPWQVKSMQIIMVVILIIYAGQ